MTKDDPGSKVVVMFFYYRTDKARKKLDELLGTGKQNGIVHQLNKVGELTIPYDGEEPDDIWETLKQKGKQELEEALKETQKIINKRKEET